MLSSISWVQQRVKSALTCHVTLGHSYVALCFTPKAVWITIVFLIRFIIETVKECWYKWRWYKYELYVPDWEREREESLKEHFKRMRCMTRVKKGELK